jgi:hypothetical protein
MTKEEIAMVREFMTGLDLVAMYSMGDYWQCFGCDGEESIITDWSKPDLHIIHSEDCLWLKIMAMLEEHENNLVT